MALHELCEALETLLLQHEQMISFAEQKKEALIANNVDVLNEMVNKESRLLRLIVETENKRVQAVNDFLKERGLSSTPSTNVANIIRMITNAEDKLRMSDLADRLSAAVERLRALNDVNMRLTQQSIEFNDFSLDLLAGAYDDQDYVYKRPSDQSHAQHNLKLFDSKA
ncbi:flagellar protein FlgN [Cohnella luojiensis]|uniref:Flagellar protein FlgN n=1 Tax=Cohnella luojiensis TaxID=652876 RepID=A0A4Y8M4B8_9BACL|nr:flagellar protein FlgN [Cohnella luojiensis]TFE29026.1 flagellar protein FlgN [Cohnella luojiensis]